MIIPVCAFHSGDAAQAASMLDWCADLCGQQPNTVVLAYEPGAPADDVLRAASRAFATVEHLPTRSAFNAWPGSANDYFAITANAMRTRGPWLWMEPDCVPTQPQWLAAIEADFMRNQKLALGTVIPMFFERDGTYQQIGEMLCGVAVYHPKIWDSSPLLRNLRQYGAAFAKANTPPRAFDSYLAHEILRVSASTPLIQHMGRSRDFRREDGRIVCSYGPESRWSPVLAPETALVHGSKDSSLINLLRAEMNLPAREHAEMPAPAVRVIETVRKAAAPTAWGTSDAIPVERLSSKSLGAVVPKKKAPIVYGEMIVMDKHLDQTIAEARNAVQHWPECKGHVFTLNVGKNDRYRVACQCGAMSGKLAEGVDWPAVWEAQAPTEETPEVIEVILPKDHVSATKPVNPEFGIAVRLHTPTEDEKRLMLEIEELKRQRDERAAYWEIRERELLAQIPRPPEAVVMVKVKRRGKAMKVSKKRTRTPEEQAKINARMAKLRARKPAMAGR